MKRTAIPASISYVIRKQLRGNATLYNYHRTFTTERLLDIDGVGEKTADILKKQGTIYCRDTGPTHYSHVVCSSCGVEFRAPYRSHMSISMKTLSHVVYCPNCQHDTIPITHISRPKPFTPGIDSE